MDPEGWDERYSQAEPSWDAPPSALLVREVEGMTPGRALDLAAGQGRNAVWLAEQGWMVTAVDFSRVAVDHGRHLAASRGVNVEWVVADLLGYQPTPGWFHLVLVFYLHLPAGDRKDVLAKATEALRAGGTVLVAGHDLTNPREGVGGPKDPAVLLDPDEVASELGDLTVERAERVPRPVEGSERPAVTTFVRARRP